ncbi:hypothetical protein E2I00_008265, partial [Balaenoptera physalus]
GVACLDQSRMCLCITLKNGLRQDAQQEDFRIFQPGPRLEDKPNLLTQKRNFRSALNQKEAFYCIWPRTEQGPPGSALDLREEFLSDMGLAPSPDGGPRAWASCLRKMSTSCGMGGAGAGVMAPYTLSSLSLNIAAITAQSGSSRGPPPTWVPSLPADCLLPQGPVAGYDRLHEAVLSCLAAGWGEEAGRSAESLAAALGPEAGALPLVLGHGLDRLPDGGHQHDGEVPKGKKGGTFHLETFVADLIIFREGSRHHLHPSWSQDQLSVKRLLVVKVVPMCLNTLPDMAHLEGTSSLGHTLDPAHFQQPLTLPHLEPVQGLSPRPGQGHGFLGHWEGLSPCSSWV